MAEYFKINAYIILRKLKIPRGLNITYLYFGCSLFCGFVRIVWIGSQENGTVFCSHYVDRKVGVRVDTDDFLRMENAIS